MSLRSHADRFGPDNLPHDTRSATTVHIAALPFCLALLLAIGGCESWLGEEALLPPDLQKLEESSEDVFDLVQAGRWERAARRTEPLHDAIAHLGSSQGIRFSDLEESSSRLNDAISSRDRYLALSQANEIYRQAIDLAGPQVDDTTRSVLLLDLEARQILINASSHPRHADEAVERLRQAWLILRPEILGRSRDDIADAMDRHLQQLGSTNSGQRELSSAGILEAIDGIEDVLLRDH